MRRPQHLKITRDLRNIILLVAGLAGTAHETLVSKGERPTLLFLFAAMMGLPYVLRSDEKPGDKPEEDDDADPPDRPRKPSGAGHG